MPIKAVMFALITIFSFTTAGCAKEEGTMEKMGKSLDEAAESTEKAAKEAAEEIKKSVDE